MTPLNRNDAIRRLIGAAFDAGVAAASRPASRRNDARIEQMNYGTSIVESWIEQDVEQRSAAGGAS
ncbi:hypothetical protein KPL78_16880 [Roseomonas sp. HJA6]|uniref:Uncharacterized protein n=1 Tax=Roseomonas alba TaxID=2846776 RepID=A0ABS7AB60_9PROT|nr:hypothetical protein [Neoroseomonas alba]MBW6399535.1 hypothetical protein [Neoroseomonas alba]